ncbi:hypothetical protein [Trichocoleus sp. FACHB-262]|uniref:hypothetical protein n=1 Tax=Trichocoleus sp. FACHB-262 TaxID=2692869 RepID=UPI001687C91F|nr:hypothetical protein [Trichocoleus sp. FACHB-262]MBD2121300.1 hypothetical protein [Trichocoleus sp. FACHB-262]
MQAFRDTDAALTQRGVGIAQSPAETVAIARAKLSALAVKAQETHVNQPGRSNANVLQTHQPTRLMWEPADPAITPTETTCLGKTTPQPALNEVRLWYVQARDIGHSDHYLKRIEEVGKALAQTQQPLSEKALQAMARDQAQWIAQVETVVDQAQTILACKGQPMAGGTFYCGKQCCLFAREGLFAATAPSRGVQPTEGDRQQLPTEMLAWERGVILKVEQGTIDSKTTRITNADVARFERFAQRLQLAATNHASIAGHER